MFAWENLFLSFIFEWFFLVILGQQVFFVGFFVFSTLNISSGTLLACKFSAEKSAHSPMGVPFYMTSQSCLAVLKLSLCFWPLTILLYCTFVWIWWGGDIIFFFWGGGGGSFENPGSKCLFPSPNLGNFQPIFFRIRFLSLLLFS